MTHLAYNVSQDGFRFYADGTESASAALAAEDTDISRAPDTVTQVRLGLQETGGANGGGSVFQLRVSKNGSGFVNVTGASANVRAAAGAMTDDEVTTNRLTGFTGSFVGGRVDEADGATTTTVDTPANDFTEIVFSITIIDADVAGGDTLDFQVTDDQDGTVTYNAVPRITVDKPVAGTATFAGDGSLVSTGATMRAGTATFAGDGVFIGNGGVVMPGVAGFTGDGSLAAVGKILFGGVGVFAGDGVFGAVGAIVAGGAPAGRVPLVRGTASAGVVGGCASAMGEEGN